MLEVRPGGAALGSFEFSRVLWFHAFLLYVKSSQFYGGSRAEPREECEGAADQLKAIILGIERRSDVLSVWLWMRSRTVSPRRRTVAAKKW